MPDRNEWDFPNDATPTGSAGYYVARFSPPEQRNSVARWLAWFAQIDQIAEKANDPGVARLKLDWWREEIQFIKNQQARHPIAIAISHEQISDWQLTQMQLALDAIEQRILKQPAKTLEEFLQQCTDQTGSRTILLAQSSEQQIQSQAKRLGCYIASIQRLQLVGRDVRHGYLSLPRDLLHQNNISVAQLEELAPLPALKQLAESILEPQEQQLLQQLPDMRQHSELHAPLRLAAQSYQLSRLMRRQQFACNQKLFNLSPLRLLWSAWRMR